jgi:prophage regulatory protein
MTLQADKSQISTAILQKRETDRARLKARRAERASQQAAAAAHDPETRLRIETVEALTGMCRSLIYAKEREGVFPSAIRIGTRFTRWRAGDVKAFLHSQAKAV